MNVLGFARELIDIDSTTGKEQAAGDWLAANLRALDYDVEEQPVRDGGATSSRHSASRSSVLSTHFDCVPPYFPAGRDGRL